jgi:hypothetical protein
MGQTLSFERLRTILVATVTQLPDARTGPNITYELADSPWGRLPCSLIRSPSFLAHQRDMQRQGRNNAQACLASMRCRPADS